MAAVLSCGPQAALSHEAGGGLWRITPIREGQIQISVPAGVRRSRPGIVVHRRTDLERDMTQHLGIPVTTPICTLVDLAACVDRRELEAAVNEADKLDLVSPEQLRAALDDMSRAPASVC
jgi:hypothetical protein